MTLADAHALSQGSPIGIGIAAVIGLATSIGPCAQSRYAFVRGHKPASTVAFLGGNLGALALLGYLGSTLFGLLYTLSPWIYAGLGLYALVIGVRTLWNVDDHSHDNDPVHSHGLSLLAGAGSALTFQPCCAPLIVATLTIAPSPTYAAIALVAYGITHNAPLFIGPLLAKRMRFAPDFSAVCIGGLSIVYGISYLIIA